MTNSNEDFIAHNYPWPLNTDVLKNIRTIHMITGHCAIFDHRMKLKSCRVCNPNEELGGQ